MEYFTFEMDGERIGYFEQRDEDGVFYCNARMVIDGEIIENPFWIKYQGEQVLAYRKGGGDFIPFSQPEGVYLSSATHILLQIMERKETFTYQFFNEGAGKVTETLTLKRSGERIEEFAGSDLRRTFILSNGKVIEYDWGGAKSRRVESLPDATAGTVFE